MPPIGRGEFEDALEPLEPAAVARFAAALYRSRRATVGHTGRPMRVEDGGRVGEFVVQGTLSSTDAGVTVDAVALHRLLLYGVDRTTCAALVDRHLGRPLDSFEGESGTVEGGAGGRRTTGARSRRDDSEVSVHRVAEGDGPCEPGDRSGWRATHFREGSSVLVAVLAVVLAVALFAVFPAGLPGAGGSDGPVPVSPSAGPVPVEPSTGDVAGAAERAALVDGTLANGLEPVATPDSERGDLPPGANASDTTEGASVAERKVVRLSNRSCRLTLVVR